MLSRNMRENAGEKPSFRRPLKVLKTSGRAINHLVADAVRLVGLVATLLVLAVVLGDADEDVDGDVVVAAALELVNDLELEVVEATVVVVTVRVRLGLADVGLDSAGEG